LANTPTTHYRVCNLCEAMCGLEIVHSENKILSIVGDEKDPFSKGSICPKGANIHELHNDPNRLKTPLKKMPDGSWKAIEWVKALDEVGDKINSIRADYGNNAVATYFGNPTVHNYGILFFAGELKRMLGTKNNFSPTSMDQLPHHFMAYYLFGHPLTIPIPDIDHTDFMLIFGANPVASNGSIMSAAGVTQRLKGIQKRGGTVVVIDPRETETARFANEHLFIKPGTDLYLLLGMLHLIAKNDWIRTGALQAFLEEFDSILALVKTICPETVAEITGIPWKKIETLTATYVKTEKAVLYGRMGMSTQEHGGLCHWVLQVINILTGHFDKPGCTLFPKPAVPVKRGRGFKKKHDRWRSRVRKLPEFDGEFPVATMAEEILTPGEGKVRGLLTFAGNPVLSSPNGKLLEKGLSQLDFMVAIDIYLNETTKHADMILPPPSHLEVDHYDLIFNLFAVQNNAKFSPALFSPKKGQLYDWQIAKALIKRFSKLSKKKPSKTLKWLTPKQLLNLGLLTGPYGKLSHRKQLFGGLSLKKLQRHIHGISLGGLASQIPDILDTKNGKIPLAHPVFLDPLKKVVEKMKAQPQAENNAFLLIGRRHLRSNNSWMHNAPSLMTGRNRCTAIIHPEDANRLGIAKGELIHIKSATGEIQIEAEISPKIMRGVVSIPHGFGHHRKAIKLDVAAAHSGVSVNDITNHHRIDPVTGNAAFSGQRVHIIT